MGNVNLQQQCSPLSLPGTHGTIYGLKPTYVITVESQCADCAHWFDYLSYSSDEGC